MLWPKPNFYFFIYIYTYNKGGPQGSTFVLLIGGVLNISKEMAFKKFIKKLWM